MKDGGVYSWGTNQFGQLGHGSVGGFRSTPQLVTGLESGATAVAAGDELQPGCGQRRRLRTGELFVGSTPVQVDPTNLSNIVAVAAESDAPPMRYRPTAACGAGALSTAGPTPATLAAAGRLQVHLDRRRPQPRRGHAGRRPRAVDISARRRGTRLVHRATPTTRG